MVCFREEVQFFWRGDDVVRRMHRGGRAHVVVIPPAIPTGYLHEACKVYHVVILGCLYFFRFIGETINKLVLSGFYGDQAGIRTQDPQLRRLLLYPAELPDRP